MQSAEQVRGGWDWTGGRRPAGGSSVSSWSWTSSRRRRAASHKGCALSRRGYMMEALGIIAQAAEMVKLERGQGQGQGQGHRVPGGGGAWLSHGPPHPGLSAATESCGLCRNCLRVNEAGWFHLFSFQQLTGGLTQQWECSAPRQIALPSLLGAWGSRGQLRAQF